MTTWEYASVPLIPHALQEILNNWGDDGWELVSVTDVAVQGGPTTLTAFLKRPKGDA